MKFNIVFLGTSQFAVPCLETLINVSRETFKFEIKLIITQPDKPQRRSLKLEYTDIKKAAIKYPIEVYQPIDINSDEAYNKIYTVKPDLLVVVSYGAFLCKRIRNICPLGVINLHPSILPFHRGADPIRSTILNGDIYTGNSIFLLTKQMDTGPIIIQSKFKINEEIEFPNFSNLSNYLAIDGANLLLQTIDLAVKSSLQASQRTWQSIAKIKDQDDSLATYSSKITKNSLIANFNLPTEQFIRHINAYSYEPGYYCIFRNKRLKLFKASIYNKIENKTYPIIKYIIKNKGFVISLSAADILIEEVQYEGKQQMSAWQFHLGARLTIGEKLE